MAAPQEATQAQAHPTMSNPTSESSRMPATTPRWSFTYTARDPREPRCAPATPCSASLRTWRLLHDPSSRGCTAIRASRA